MGPQAAEDESKCSTVEIGHVDVGDHRPNLGVALRKQADGLDAVTAGNHAIAVLGQDGGGHVAHVDFVVDHEDKFALPAGRGGREVNVRDVAAAILTQHGYRSEEHTSELQ